jgi:predicted GIY-YIG superfamily endonuclease
MLGRTIRIYLDNGSVTGIKHSEIVNWSGQAISSPRNLVKDLKEWTEAQRPGVYFLFGLDENGDESVYIGESENVFERLVQHVSDSKKDFWDEVIFFTSKDENLTKAHVKFLESKLTLLAKEANRYKILNGNNPQQSKLPRGDRDSMEEFINNIRILIGAMSHKVLEPMYKQALAKEISLPDNKNDNTINANIELFLNIKKINSKAILTEEGIVVQKGSEAFLRERDSLGLSYKNLRNKLQEDNILIPNEEKLIFTQDYLFPSPSQAAAVIVGYAINGRSTWCLSDGTTLKEYEEKQLIEDI